MQNYYNNNVAESSLFLHWIDCNFDCLLLQFCKSFCELNLRQSNENDYLQTSCHELTLERIESALGAEDNVMSFEGLRVKKFNRTT